MKDKKLSTISIAIATYNEEKNLPRCLDAVKDWVDEIVIADGSSADNTVAIAKKYKAKVIETTNKPIFHINKNMAIEACTSDWILQLDADEVVSKELKEEIQTILKKDPKDVEENGFWINRSNYFLGSFLKKGGQYPDATNRLYKKGKGKLPCKDVHEQTKIEGKVGQLENDLLHYADPSFSRYLLRSNRYTSLEAKLLIERGFKLSFGSAIEYFLIKPLVWFLSTFFRHKGFVDGFPGFVFSLFSSLRFPIIYIKIWELKKTNRKLNLQSDWD